MKHVKVLKMTSEDVGGVFHIEELVHPKHHWSKSSFYNEVSNSLAVYYCIKDDDNNILAYAGIWQIFEEVHITALAVHPDYRGLQLAQILLVQIFMSCYTNMAKYVTLEVRESNFPAITLYEKFLFESIGVRKNYYQDNGENAVIMFTQNIWYDAFKNNFNIIKSNINKVDVSYAE